MMDIRKNVFSFYYENDKNYRFFIKQSNWSNSIAEVLFFKGVDEGSDLLGAAPYFNNPIVFCKLWFVTSPIDIKETSKYKIIQIKDGSTFRYDLAT